MPAGGRDALRRVCGGGGMPEEHVEHAFDLHEYAPEDVVEVGTLRVRFHRVPHFLPTCAVDVSSTNGSGRFTYGADSAPNEELVRFADGTDLLMIEATLPRPEREGPRGHLTPVGGRRARQQGARAPARADPHLRRARRRLGPARGREGLRRARSTSPSRAPSSRVAGVAKPGAREARAGVAVTAGIASWPSAASSRAAW